MHICLNSAEQKYVGPAHAVYFATYEAVKHAMGGNQAGVHHPLAAGKLPPYREHWSLPKQPRGRSECYGNISVTDV